MDYRKVEFGFREIVNFDVLSSETIGGKACHGRRYVNAVGHLYEVLDKSLSGSDEFFETWNIGGPGGGI